MKCTHWLVIFVLCFSSVVCVANESYSGIDNLAGNIDSIELGQSDDGTEVQYLFKLVMSSNDDLCNYVYAHYSASGEDYIYKGYKESRELFSDIVWKKYPINQAYRAVWFSHIDVDNDGVEEVVVRFVSERSYRYFQEISVFNRDLDTKKYFSVNVHKGSLVDIRFSEYALKTLTKDQIEKYSTPIKSPPRMGSILVEPIEYKGYMYILAQDYITRPGVKWILVTKYNGVHLKKGSELSNHEDSLEDICYISFEENKFEK